MSADRFVFKSIDTECQGLCKKDNASILRRISPADLVDLKLENLKGELCLKAPMSTKLLPIICKSKRSKSKSQELMRWLFQRLPV